MRLQFDPWPCSVDQGSVVAVSCGIGQRQGLDLVWLWRRLGATAPAGPLAWESPYATGETLKSKSK